MNASGREIIGSAAARPAGGSGGRAHILAADDDPLSRSLQARLAGLLGHRAQAVGGSGDFDRVRALLDSLAVEHATLFAVLPAAARSARHSI